MQASVQFRAFRPHNRELGMIVRTVDEDLPIFLENRKGEKDRNGHILALESDEFDDGSSGASPNVDRLLTSNGSQSEKIEITSDYGFVISDTDRIGHDRLPKELDASPLPLLEGSMEDSPAIQIKSSNGKAILEASNSPVESASLSKKSVPLVTSTGLKSSMTENGNPLASGGRRAGPRSATPIEGTSLPANSRSSHPAIPFLKGKEPISAQKRSSTPARGVSISLKSSTKIATPSHKPSTQAMTSRASSKEQSSLGRKICATMSKVPEVSLGTHEFIKTAPSKPSVMLVSSHDTQNSMSWMAKRSDSASRERQSAPTTLSPNAKSRQKPCPPSKLRVPNGNQHKSKSMMQTRNRGHKDSGDEVNPVLMGSKMVERVVSMRKLAPPKQAEYSSHDYSRKNFQESMGFGRSFSKKSLDMALRHMDIRWSIHDDIRPRP